MHGLIIMSAFEKFIPKNLTCKSVAGIFSIISGIGIAKSTQMPHICLLYFTVMIHRYLCMTLYFMNTVFN